MPSLREIDQKPEEFMQALKAFVARPRGYLVLAGKNGNGKTFSAKAIFDHFARGYDCNTPENLFWNQAQLNSKWLEDFNNWGSTSYLLEKIVNAPLLVLDDVGTRKPSDAFMDFLYCIADQRFDNRENVGTIITTNLSTDAMREMMGDAFVSRVSSGINVRYEGLDRRTEEF